MQPAVCPTALGSYQVPVPYLLAVDLMRPALREITGIHHVKPGTSILGVRPTNPGLWGLGRRPECHVLHA